MGTKRDGSSAVHGFHIWTGAHIIPNDTVIHWLFIVGEMNTLERDEMK